MYLYLFLNHKKVEGCAAYRVYLQYTIPVSQNFRRASAPLWLGAVHDDEPVTPRLVRNVELRHRLE